MFVQSAKFIDRHKGNLRKISIYGQESNPDTWKIAQMNLAIHGLEANLGRVYADSFLDDQHPTLKADYILANPPFNPQRTGGKVRFRKTCAGSMACRLLATPTLRGCST